MGAAKDHFLKDKDAAAKLNACAHADWFQHAIILARSEVADSGASAEENRGARKLADTLLQFGDPDPEGAQPFPSSGLVHDLDIKPREKKPEPKKE
jgi:hypothetical protein